MNIKIYCDMDGVLVDLVGGIQRSLKTSYNADLITELLSMDFSWRKKHPDPNLNLALDEIKELLSDNPTFWGDTLQPLPDALELWEYISQFELNILSHPWDKDSLDGKEFWVANHLSPRPKEIHLPLDGKKHLFAINPDETPNILIDDFSKYIDKWKAAGGIAITHTSTKNTIEELEKIIKYY